MGGLQQGFFFHQYILTMMATLDVPSKIQASIVLCLGPVRVNIEI